MPVHAYTMQAGSRSRSVLVYGRAQDQPAVGLNAESSGVAAAFARDDGTVSAISLRTGQLDHWMAGSFVEMDADLMPGIYLLSLPDEAIAQGATRAMVTIQAPGVHFDPVDIDLVAFDQQDPYSLGMVALTAEARMSCLSGAFPRLAALEKERSSEAAG